MDRWIEYQSAGGVEGIVGDEEKEEEKVAYVEDVPILDDKQWSELEAVDLSDERVNASMKDKQYRLYSHSFVRYLEYSDLPNNSVEPNKWYANIVYIYHEGNDKYLLSALVDVEEKKVVDVLIVKHPSQEFRSSTADNDSDLINIASHNRPSFSIAYYNGTATNTYYFSIRVNAPTSYNGQISPHENLDFVLNATKKNSTTSELCIPSNRTNSYWAQVGMVWSYNTKDIVWTDTREGCGHRFYSRVPYGDSNRYIFSIHTSRSGSAYTWYICAINLTARVQECQQRSNIDEGTFLTTNKHSSVWLENWIVTSNWYTYFGSNIQAGNAKYKKVGDSTVYNWDSTVKIDQDCRGRVYLSNIISGDVTNGQWATWNLQTMATSYPAC
ncbi:MAG: hypothetical protein QW653_06535 [Candidatus Nitrosocaldus sp.]